MIPTTEESAMIIPSKVLELVALSTAIGKIYDMMLSASSRKNKGRQNKITAGNGFFEGLVNRCTAFMINLNYLLLYHQLTPTAGKNGKLYAGKGNLNLGVEENV